MRPLSSSTKAAFERKGRLHEEQGKEHVVVTHGKEFMQVQGHFQCLMTGPYVPGSDVACHHIHVHGLPDFLDPNHDLMGVYVLELTTAYGKPIYRCGSSYLYFFEDANRKQWIVGSRPGANEGWMVVDTKTATARLLQGR